MSDSCLTPVPSATEGGGETGPGMPPEVQARIFEAFWQADGSTTRQHKGYGLGLSIVKNTVKGLGGEVGVRSRLGSGGGNARDLRCVDCGARSRPERPPARRCPWATIRRRRPTRTGTSR